MACDPLDSTAFGRAFVVTDEENCSKELIQSDGGNYPALAVALSSERAELRDGSVNQPIELPHLQSVTGSVFQRMMVMDSSGRWHVFTPGEFCVDRKMIVRNQQFMLVPDTLPPYIEADICEVDTCDDVDYIIGLREVDLSECLEGEFFEMVKIPKSLCPTCEEEP